MTDNDIFNEIQQVHTFYETAHNRMIGLWQEFGNFEQVVAAMVADYGYSYGFADGMVSGYIDSLYDAACPVSF